MLQRNSLIFSLIQNEIPWFFPDFLQKRPFSLTFPDLKTELWNSLIFPDAGHPVIKTSAENIWAA